MVHTNINGTVGNATGTAGTTGTAIVAIIIIITKVNGYYVMLHHQYLVVHMVSAVAVSYVCMYIRTT